MAQWSTKKKDALPDSSFAYVSDGKRALPYKDASGNINPAHVRNALARINQTDIPPAGKKAAMAKLHAAAKKVGIKVAECMSGATPMKKTAKRAATKDTKASESVETPATTTNSASLQTLAENVELQRPFIFESANPFAESAGKDKITLNEDGTGVIRDVSVLRGTSSNRRIYPREVVEAAAKNFEGATVYLNHPVDRKNPTRDVSKIAGSIHGVYFDDQGVFRAKELRAHGPAKDVLITCAKECPDRCGMSIFASGQAEPAQGKPGWEKVTHIGHVESVDLVAKPASTRHLFESNEPSNVSEGQLATASAMDAEGEQMARLCRAGCDSIWSLAYDRNLEHDERRAKMIALLNEWIDELNDGGDIEATEAVETGADTGNIGEQPSAGQGASEPKTESQNMDAVIDLGKADLKQLRESRPDLVEALTADAKKEADSAKAKLAEHEARSAAAVLADKVCRELKLPAHLRTAVFMDSLIRAGTEDSMKAIVEDRMVLVTEGAHQARRGPISEESDPMRMSGGYTPPGAGGCTIDEVRASFGIKAPASK